MVNKRVQRNDYTALRFRLAQDLKPHFVLVDSDIPGVAEIRDASDVQFSLVGSVDFRRFQIELDWERWLEPFEDDAIYRLVVDSAWGDGDKEWANRGWLEADVEIYSDWDDGVANGFAVRGSFGCDSIEALHAELRWALAPREIRFDRWEELEVKR